MSNSVREETMATAGQAQVLESTTDEVVNTVVDADTSVAPTRYFTVPGIDPFDASSQTIVGRLAMKRKDVPLALRSFRSALAAGPQDRAAAHTDLGHVCHEHAEMDDAIFDTLLRDLDRGDVSGIAENRRRAVANLADDRDRRFMADIRRIGRREVGSGQAAKTLELDRAQG